MAAVGPKAKTGSVLFSRFFFLAEHVRAEAYGIRFAAYIHPEVL